MEGQSESKCPAGKKPDLIFPFMAPLYCAGSCIYWPLLRFIAGIDLVPHGSQKLFGLFGGGGMEHTIAAFGQMGFSPALTWAAACTEFFGGLMIAFGFLTRFGAAAATILLTVAMFKVHMPHGYFNGNGGYEYPMLWAVVCFAIFLRGGGPFSVDARIGKEL
jgi:putative oxidoreductase